MEVDKDSRRENASRPNSTGSTYAEFEYAANGDLLLITSEEDEASHSGG